MDTSEARRIRILGDGNVVGDRNNIQVIKANSGSLVFAGDSLFEQFTKARTFSSSIRHREFRALVNERTRGFIGRRFIFDGVDQLLRQETTFPSGYIVIYGEPGIGKTSLMAELVKTRGWVHHFIIGAQNIATPRDFLVNTCSQLIVRYRLQHSGIPEEAASDSGFLAQLMSEAAETAENRPIVILIDGLDEASEIGLSPAANALYLPPTLPDDVFVIVTTREQIDYRLFVDRRHDIYLDDNDPRNQADVREFVFQFIARNLERMTQVVESSGVSEDDLLRVLLEKSQGNFMYLVHVMRDICDGKLAIGGLGDIANLPQGLRGYYQRNWRIMRSEAGARFDVEYQPVLCMLAVAQEMVSTNMIAEWTGLSERLVQQAIDSWRQFLNCESDVDGSLLYRIYHSSFRDFLRDQVGLEQYHRRIVELAMRKIRWRK